MEFKIEDMNRKWFWIHYLFEVSKTSTEWHQNYIFIFKLRILIFGSTGQAYTDVNVAALRTKHVRDK